jgi:Cft2 family RNA processing exonuclease
MIFMTETTKEFVKYQLAATIGEYIGEDTKELRFHNRILCEFIMNRITVVECGKKDTVTLPCGKKMMFSLFHAGHIPGAAMVYLAVDGKTVLYTGDFSAKNTLLTFPYMVDEKVKPQTLIMCSTRSNDPDSVAYTDNVFFPILQKIHSSFAKNGRLIMGVSQLTKGLELLCMLEREIDSGEMIKFRIYLEPNLWELASFYESRSETFRLPDYVMPLDQLPEKPKDNDNVIVFEKAGYDIKKYPNFTKINSDFTLHADYLELVRFINNTEPRKVFLVHAAGGTGKLTDKKWKDSLESIIYTENGEEYYI